DLRGGVSLIYSVAIGPGESAEQVLERTIDVLKRRVDPDGLFEISMVAAGRDRIEITMPLPGERVKELRAQYEAALEAVGRMSLTDSEFNRLMAMDRAAREAEITRIAQGNPPLEANLRAAATAADTGRDAARAVSQAIASGSPAEEIDNLAAMKADADSRFASIRAEVLGSSLTAEMVRQALSLSNRESRLEDEDSGQMVPIPSERQRALDALRERFPESRPALEGAVEAFNQYTAERRTLDDPQDLVRLLRGSGVLNFRITVDPGQHPDEQRLRAELQERGPTGTSAADARWFKINQIRTWYDSLQTYEALTANPAGYFLARGYVVEEWGGEYWMLCWDVDGYRLTSAEGQWSVAAAFPQTDRQGRPGIGFEMDPRGATLLGRLTGAHVSDQMAVLLDDEVYTAPNLNSQISRSGIIEGAFSQQEIQYIVRVLSAGSLQAKLSREPISQITIGPELGLDNLQQGVKAGWIALIVVGGFMVVYYFLYGIVALVCLVSTALLILGAMALQEAAFSLPGIAGIILTFGMAVDANVLVFERVREELNAGKDLRTAIRLGYSKALSAIVDGNVTNLIVCIVLVLPGVATPEIKGFAITLGVGVLATLFAALVIGRLILNLCLAAGVRRLKMLPMAVPVIDRILTPKINWLSLRWVFVGISTVYVALGLGMVAFRGNLMLDTEFRGGTKVTLQFRPGADGSLPVRADVDEQIRGATGVLARLERQAAELAVIAARPGATDQQIADAQAVQRRLTAVEQLRNADILPVNPRADGITSDRFTIKSLVTDAPAVLTTITSGFADFRFEIDGRPALPFAGSSIPVNEIRSAPVYPILTPRLAGAVPGVDATSDVDVTAFQGGVAILLEGFATPPSLEDIRVSLEDMRQKPDFSSTLARDWDVRVLAGTDAAVQQAVVLVADEDLSFFDDEDRWWSQLARTEWSLTSQALTDPTTLAQVENFSPQVADT
ncbi:MAG: protein translocase subunit SecD, partial [Phycisphaerales bacterium]|nr:protein translocase subunit SecD [Phycisphaerales bacterium]